MRSFLFSMLALGLFFCSPVSAAETCQSLKRLKPTKSISLRISDPHYDLDLTTAELNADLKQRHEEWLKKNGLELVMSADGLKTVGQISSGWAISTKASATSRPYDKNSTPRKNCLYFHDINVMVEFRSIITIPKEFTRGGCSYNNIHKHEMTHYNINEKIVRAAGKKLEAELPHMIEKAEASIGPIAIENEQEEYEKMATALKTEIASLLLKETTEELKKQNEAFDSPEEYTRSSEELKACAN